MQLKCILVDLPPTRLATSRPHELNKRSKRTFGSLPPRLQVHFVERQVFTVFKSGFSTDALSQSLLMQPLLKPMKGIQDNTDACYRHHVQHVPCSRFPHLVLAGIF